MAERRDGSERDDYGDIWLKIGMAGKVMDERGDAKGMNDRGEQRLQGRL